MDGQFLEIKKKVSERFSRWAATYDKSPLQNLVFRHSHNMFLREIKPRPRIRLNLLDVGCGTGEFAFRLTGYSNDIQIDGVDISPDMIKIAKSKLYCSNIRFKVGDVENLPYGKETFDIITCSHSFHHYPKQKRAVAEMHRVLKTNGRLMIIDGSRDTALGKIIFGKVIRKLEKNVYHILAKEIKELFQTVGFERVTQKILNPFVPLLFTSGIKGEVASSN